MISNRKVLPRLPAAPLYRAIQFVAAALLGMACLAPVASAKSGQPVTAMSGVTYVSGGAGTEEIDQLRSMEKDFNLKMVFALKSGAYLAEVNVTIVDAANTGAARHSGRGAVVPRPVARRNLSGERELSHQRRASHCRRRCSHTQHGRIALAKRVTVGRDPSPGSASALPARLRTCGHSVNGARSRWRRY